MSNAADDLDELDEITEADEADEETTEAGEVVEDPDSFIQSRRLKDIFNARREMRKQRLKAKRIVITAKTEREARAGKRAYRAAVEGYLQELRPLFMADDQGTQVWFNLDFGTLKIPLPIEKERYGRSGALRYVHTTIENGEEKKYRVSEPPEPKEIELRGLNYLFDLPDPIAVEFEVISISSGRWGDSTGTNHITQRYDIGFDRLDQVVNEANHRLEQRGLDLELSEDNAVAEADYSDIV